MRLCHIITGLNTGGAERALHNLLAGGLAKRHDCAVVSLGDIGTYGAHIRALGVPVHALGMCRGAPTPAAPWRLCRIVRGFRPDLVQGWMYHGNLAAWLACKFAVGRPVLAWNVRQSLYGLREEKRLTQVVIHTSRVSSRAPAALLYNSVHSRVQHECFGFHAARGRVIPNGFDLAYWQPATTGECARTRQALGIPEDALVIGHVARVHPMKDHVRFLRVAVRLAESYPDLHLLLVGTNVTADQPLWRGWIPARLGRRIHFLGERNDVPALMQSMDMLCQSSWSEAFPNVLGEAMACGVPCVATDVGDSACIIGDTGITVPASDDVALHEGLSRLLDAGADARQALGRAARARVESRYGIDSVVAQYQDLYISMVNGR